MSYTSSVRFPLDLEASVTLRNSADAAETASGVEAAIDLNKSVLDGGQTYLLAPVVVHVTELDTTSDETYVVYAQVSTTEAFTVPVNVGSVTVTKAGEYTIWLDGPTIDKLVPGASFLRVGHTLGGTTPSIKYHAWLSRPHC